MPHKKRSNYPSKRRPPKETTDDRYVSEYAGYVRSNLSLEQRQEFKALNVDAATILHWIIERANDGCKVSLAIRGDGTGFKASMSDMDTESQAHGYYLGAEAGTPDSALALLFYKDTTVFGGDWDKGIINESEDGDWFK